LVSATIGVTSQYPEATAFILEKLHRTGPYNATGFLSAKQRNGVENFAYYADQHIYDDYFVGGPSILQSPVLQEVFHEQVTMGLHGVPRMPLFVYKAIHDEFSPVADTDALVNEFCADGANILYQRNTIGGHIAEITNGDASAFDWLISVLEGKYHHDGCTIQNVTIDITSSPL
jgi:hypothetical protein